jgi:hypothetical protein
MVTFSTSLTLLNMRPWNSLSICHQIVKTKIMYGFFGQTKNEGKKRGEVPHPQLEALFFEKFY